MSDITLKVLIDYYDFMDLSRYFKDIYGESYSRNALGIFEAYLCLKGLKSEECDIILDIEEIQDESDVWYDLIGREPGNRHFRGSLSDLEWKKWLNIIIPDKLLLSIGEKR